MAAAQFSDTSLLLRWAMAEGDGECREVLENHECQNVTGPTVEREFDGLKDRRIRILESIYEVESIDDWSPPPDVRLSPNDRNWCGRILAELDEMADKDAIERRINHEVRKITRGWDRCFGPDRDIIDTVAPGSRDVYLLSFLDFIDDDNDRRIIAECANWSEEGGTGDLVTCDENHMLGNKDRIEQVVEDNRNVGEIELFGPQAYVQSSN